MHCIAKTNKNKMKQAIDTRWVALHSVARSKGLGALSITQRHTL